MCGRYYVNEKTWKSVEEYFPQMQVLERPVGDMTPAMRAMALASGGNGGTEARGIVWGFPGREKGNLLINARAESVESRPTFSESFAARRCLLPSAGFYEWDRERNKVTFSLEGSDVLFLAGIWRKHDQAEQFVIITREANDSMTPYHDRMPLIISPEDAALWISDLPAAKELLMRPLPYLEAKRDMEQLSFDFGEGL